MAQNIDILVPAPHYTRADFTALRAYLNRLTTAQIAHLYYSEDDLEALGCTDDIRLRQYLETMRDTLVQRAADVNPHAADLLRHARKSHTWSKAAIDFLVRAADQDWTRPKRTDPVSMWFKPRVANPLKAEGASTLAGLLELIHARGYGWWKPIPRIGEGKAQAIVRWLGQHEAALGSLPASARVRPRARTDTDIVLLGPDCAPRLVPLERIALVQSLDGSRGINRAPAFCLITARNDLEAIDSYLYKFRAQEKTRRAYQKELERFLLWCVQARRKAMSSVLMEDCEAYKDFLAAPDPAWIGPKAPRLGPDWKPFAGIPAPKSQRYAVQILRTFFTWLVNVRYLGGNPWVTVADPPVARELAPLQLDKALPADLWHRLVGDGGFLDQLGSASLAELQGRYALRGWAADLDLPAQFRLVRAALLLLGDSGLRREEAAFASRAHLKPVPGVPDLWELDVLGKRNKWRTVFLPTRAIAALQAHWADRGLDFDFGLQDIPLLSPLVAPATRLAQQKHTAPNGERKESGFSPDGLYQVVKTALQRIAQDNAWPLEAWERASLLRAAPHAFRHTFGTLAAAQEVPLDVLQKVLGHASLQTTTIYVQAEKRRSIEELGKFFRK